MFVGVSDRIAIEQLGIMHILILTRECGVRGTPCSSCVCGSKYKIAIEQLGTTHILILTRECGTRNTPLRKLYSGYACLGYVTGYCI